MSSTETPPEPKKRGRKPKATLEEKANEAQEPKQRKKRGRKAAVKYFSSSIRKKLPLTTAIHDSNNYILHLDVQDDSKSNDEGNDVGNIGGTSNSELEKLFNNVVLNDEEDTKEDSSISDEEDAQSDLTELYEKRIKAREVQDKKLIDKLEMLHQDEDLLSKLVIDETVPEQVEKQENQSEEKQNDNRQYGYFQLMNQLVDKDWCERCDIACWWCCHNFDTVPLGLPQDYSHKTKQFRVRGIFCSFACMLAYSQNSKIIGRDSEPLIKHLYSKLSAESISAKLNPAPPRAALKMFGGELTIEEFRNSTIEKKAYKMVIYPMFVSRDYVEEIDIANVKKANMKVFDENSFKRVISDEKRVADAKVRLASQIEKTTVTLGNTIDKFINIS
jgi:hypothetical protein